MFFVVPIVNGLGRELITFPSIAFLTMPFAFCYDPKTRHFPAVTFLIKPCAGFVTAMHPPFPLPYSEEVLLNLSRKTDPPLATKETPLTLPADV